MFQGITQALSEFLWCQARRVDDPVDFVPQGGVEDSRVVGADNEIDVGLDKAVHRVQLRTGHAAKTHVGTGTGFDDSADAGDILQGIGLPVAHLLEAVFVAQICAEAGDFTIANATDAVVAKLVRRHPHVFGGSDTETDAGRRDLSPAEVKEQWERIKTRERAGTPERATLLDGIPKALPSLLRASRIGARTANVGFDWDEPGNIIDKVDEELAELRQAVASADLAHIEEELGDLLFTVANLARKLRVDPESALRAANGKFTRRFRAIEQRLAMRGRSLHDATPEELEHEWQAVKQEENDNQH